jgi:hypothetical protein
MFPKRRLTFNGLYEVISEKVELYVTTDVRILHLIISSTVHKGSHPIGKVKVDQVQGMEHNS